MPTPRFVAQVSRQAAVAPPNPDGSSGDWVGGTVAFVNGFINATYQVELDVGGTVIANSVVDSPIVAGSRVWVVRAVGGVSLIVGAQ